MCFTPRYAIANNWLDNEIEVSPSNIACRISPSTESSPFISGVAMASIIAWTTSAVIPSSDAIPNSANASLIKWSIVPTTDISDVANILLSPV